MVNPLKQKLFITRRDLSTDHYLLLKKNYNTLKEIVLITKTKLQKLFIKI